MASLFFVGRRYDTSGLELSRTSGWRARGTKLEHAWPKKAARRAQNEAEEFPRFDGICLFVAIDAPHKRLLFNNNWSEQLFSSQSRETWHG